MEICNLDTAFINRPDKNDPLNQLLTVAAKASVDGVICGWSATVIIEEFRTYERAIERAIERAMALLIAKILTKPRNPIDIGVPTEPQPEVIIADVEITEGVLAPASPLTR